MMEPEEKEWERQIDLGSQGQPGIEKRQETEKEKEIEKEQEEEKEKEMEKEEKKAEEGEEEEKEGNEVAMMGISATLEKPLKKQYKARTRKSGSKLCKKCMMAS